MDKGHRYTDKQIEALERRLSRFYKGVSADLIKRLMEYLKQHEDEINALWERLDNGEKVDIEGFINRELNGEINILSEQCVKADQNAMKYVGAAMATVFAFNNKTQAETLKKKTGIKIPKKKKRLLPPSTDKAKDRLWHRVKIRFVITDGLRHGRSIDDIARKMEVVTRMDTNAAYRAARTACTNAENQGKLEAMRTLRDEFGVDVKKMWFATLDNRTRTSHRMMHGEIRELDDEFSNGLQYPADPDGRDSSEIWNCRCTLMEVINDFDIPVAPKGMSRSEWEQQKPKYKHYPKRRK